MKYVVITNVFNAKSNYIVLRPQQDIMSNLTQINTDHALSARNRPRQTCHTPMKLFYLNVNFLFVDNTCKR